MQTTVIVLRTLTVSLSCLTCVRWYIMEVAMREVSCAICCFASPDEWYEGNITKAMISFQLMMPLAAPLSSHASNSDLSSNQLSVLPMALSRLRLLTHMWVLSCVWDTALYHVRRQGPERQIKSSYLVTVVPHRWLNLLWVSCTSCPHNIKVHKWALKPRGCAMDAALHTRW